MAHSARHSARLGPLAGRRPLWAAAARSVSRGVSLTNTLEGSGDHQEWPSQIRAFFQARFAAVAAAVAAGTQVAEMWVSLAEAWRAEAWRVEVWRMGSSRLILETLPGPVVFRPGVQPQRAVRPRFGWHARRARRSPGEGLCSTRPPSRALLIWDSCAYSVYRFLQGGSQARTVYVRL